MPSCKPYFVASHAGFFAARRTSTSSLGSTSSIPLAPISIAATMPPYVDENGEYIVALHLDRDGRTRGMQSCRMRLAKPFAGAGRTGFHFLVGFHHGNCDLPFISQVLHNAATPDPIVSYNRWLSRSTIHTRANNTIEFEDFEGEEHIKVATEQGKTQLNLGHTVDRNRKLRGSGFELRTDLHGSVRAGGGLFVSADKQARAMGEQTNTEAATNEREKIWPPARRLVGQTFLVPQCHVEQLGTRARLVKWGVSQTPQWSASIRRTASSANGRVMSPALLASVLDALPLRARRLTPCAMAARRKKLNAR